MVKKSKGGRPSKLTPNLRKEIVGLIKGGNFTEMTCAIAGINKSTYYDWMKLGEESVRRNKYKLFYDEVTKAHAFSEARDVCIVSKAAETDWRAAAWILERRFRERWGKPKTEKNTSIRVSYGNNDVSVNYPVTRIVNGKKRNAESVAIKKCVITKNY